VKAVAPQEQAAASAAKAAPVQAVPQEKPVAAVAVTPAKTPAVKTPIPAKSTEAVTEKNQVSAVDFQVVGDISRVMVKVSGSPVVEKPVKLPGSVAYRIRNVQLPRNLQRSLEAREFVSPVLRITPVVIRTKTGSDVLVRVTMKKDAAFDFRQEADILYLDFKHPAEMAAAAAEPQQTAATQKAVPAAEPVAAPAVAAHAKEEQMLQEAQQNGAGAKRMYTGRKVTLEFADAEVRKIFQLLSEVSNKNFVLGDEVTGNISLKLVNVPWDQALDIILDTKGLDKREEGNIVLIRGKGKFKSLMDEEVENRKAALKGEPLETAMFDVNYADLGSIVTQFTALKTDRGMISQDQRTNKIIVKDVKAAIEDMRTILKSLDIQEKQVMIEARIVEASSTFTQTLGINWGIHYRDGSASIAGINAFDTSFGGLASNAAPASGVSGNPGATAGISFGTLSSNIKLDMRLNAAVSAGLVRIVSTPRVATLNHKSAKITQGQQIPYTSSTSDKVETKFVEAALALEVTPHINPNGTIIMKIDAKNDSPGSTGSPPPINKKQATTEMMLRDGETTVIGGIYVERESGGEDGVPFLKDVPWLGNLFKSTDTKRSKDELLIFITPRIITSSI
jgi:type IV pilus assembly protein PilQ